MCGIAGAIGDLAGLDTRAALRAMTHRGPDDEGEFSASLGDSGGVWLGHRRRSIQDLSSAAHQPMLRGDRYAVVFNGEVYNFAALREELEGRGERFTSRGDTEVVLAAWSAWGVRCVERFKGMFAIALWDGLERRLHLVRDRLGEKPLYVVEGRGRVAFASEVRSLLEMGAAERELDDDGLDATLVYGSVYDPYTILHGVRCVEAGEHVAVGPEGVLRRRRYWSLAELPAGVVRDRREAVEGVRSRFDAALRRVMVADVPVAVLLSGGIDSSSNVAWLSRRFSNLRTFSVVFGAADSALDEAPYADLVARRFSPRHDRVEVSLDVARALVPRAIADLDHPSQDGVNTWLVTHAIGQAGLRVAVSGQGNDELFLGYGSRQTFPWLRRGARMVPGALKDTLPPVVKHLPMRRDTAAERLAQTLLSRNPDRAAYAAQRSVFPFAGLDRLRGQSRPSPLRFITEPGGVDPLDRLSRYEVGHYLKNTLLRDGDQMSMAHGVEMRAPALDVDLVEYALSIAPEVKLDPRRNKPLVLDSIGTELPREVWDRPKAGFALPYRRWLREGLDLPEPDGPELGLDRKAVRAVREGFMRGQLYTPWWLLVVLTAWVRRHRIGTRRLR